MKRKAGIAAILAGLLTGAYLLAAGLGLPGLGPRRETAGEPVRLYGNVEIRDAQLAFNGSEHITEVLAEEGDRVEQGERLAVLAADRLDARIREAEARRDARREVLRRLENGTRPREIERARAELRAAEAKLANSQIEEERLRRTTGGGATSRRALDDAEARLAVDQAAVEVLRESLQLAIDGPREEDLAEARATLAQLGAAAEVLRVEKLDTILLAPSAGVIQTRLLEPGEYATPDRPVFTLDLTDRKWVRAFLPQPQMGRVAEGMAAEVTSDSFPDHPFSGRVGFISPTAEFTPKTVQTTELRPQLVYEIRIHIDDPDDRLRLGQPVTVDIVPEKPASPSSGRKAAGPP